MGKFWKSVQHFMLFIFHTETRSSQSDKKQMIFQPFPLPFAALLKIKEVEHFVVRPSEIEEDHRSKEACKFWKCIRNASVFCQKASPESEPLVFIGPAVPPAFRSTIQNHSRQAALFVCPVIVNAAVCLLFKGLQFFSFYKNSKGIRGEGHRIP